MTKQILLSLLNCSWQWGLLGCLTWLVTRRFRRTNSTTHLLSLLLLLSLPILFALNQFVPTISIGSTAPELMKAQPVEISGLMTQTVDLPEITTTESGMQSQAHTVAGSQFSFNWTTTNLILCIWAVGTLAMLIRVAFGLYRIHRLRRTAIVADDSYQAVCKRLAQKLNIDRPVTVCFSDRVVSPISFGWLSPYILIPIKMNLDQFELVAAHELAHVQRLDWLTNLFSHIVGAIFFFHPIYYFLNRKLVHLRERICDDWVIQLTGARKNYAQCLLDMVHHKEQAIPLTLGLNEPSELESRINSILKNNRQLDLKPRRRLRVVAVTLLLTCLPLLAMAQLVPLRTVQLSLFAQTPQESEKAVEKVEKKRGEQKKLAEMKDKKEYKEDKSIKVLDPSAFTKSQENRLFSGPQPGEKLPALMVTGTDGELDGQIFDITAEADGKPLVLFLQNTNGVGVKGLVGVSQLLLKINAFQKRNSTATGTEVSNQGLQIGVVFLTDDLDTLPMLKKGIPNKVLTGISPDGREGPGSYGLNRNVAQTIIIAKDGKVLHNFAFTQPMLYTDPHLLGAIAQAIEVEPAALEKWLNDKELNRYMTMVAESNARLLALNFENLRAELKQGRISKKKAAEKLKKLGITWEEGEQLLKKTNDDAQMMHRERQYENRRQVEVADPADFGTSDEKRIFSGPQPGEKLPPLKATGISGAAKGKTFDFIAKAGGQPLVLVLQDESGVGLRGLYDISRIVDKISNESKQELQISVVFLSDDPAALKQITQHVPENVLVGISPDGREGPGSYGLNRNVSQTVIIAKESKVLQNFAFTQPLLFADPHVLGAIADVIQEKPETVAKWLNEAPAEGERMQRGGVQENVTIPDANLAAVVRDALGLDPSAPIPKKKLETLETLRALKKNIGDLTGLEKATGLKTLIIRGDYSQNQIKDITPLAGLTQLTELSLSENRITDIKPLAGLAQLKKLRLNNNGLIRDITPLGGLRQLTQLSLYNNLIRDITPLTGLTQLKSLRIFMNEISNITPLANLKQLTELDLSINQIHDITPLTNLKQLADLRLQANQIRDITPLANLKQLTYLGLQANQIRDITPLSGLRQLTWLALSNNPIKIQDMRPLRMLLKQQPDLEIDIALPPAEERNRYRRDRIEVKNPAEFKKTQKKDLFSGPQPGEKLPPLMATGINGETKDKTYDVIAKAEGKTLVLFLQDESGLGLRGLVGFSRLLAQIAEKSKQKMHINAVFLGDTPDTLKDQASKLVPHIPSGVLLGISLDGREGPGSYGLNRSVAQTVIIAKDGKVLYNFAFTQPMLRPDPHLLGAVGEAIGVKPATLEKWLNLKNPVIEIKNPAEGEEAGKMLLNGTFVLNGSVVHLDGTVVQFDELLTFLRNLPEEQKSMLIIQSERDVPHEQIVKVMDIAKEAGIDKIGLGISEAENKPMESGSEQMRRGED